MAIPNTSGIAVNTTVKLTASVSTGINRTYKLIIIPDVYINARFVNGYARVGTPLKVTVYNPGSLQFNYEWRVAGIKKGNNSDTYTPVEAERV